MQLSILQSGTREGLKGAVHGSALCLGALIALYNIAAWFQRRQRHLAFNSFVYVLLVAFEQYQVRHHWAAMQELADRVLPDTTASTEAEDRAA